MSRNNIEAVALDFDGVLGDTIGTHNAARLDAFSQMAEATGDARYFAPSKVHAEAHRHGSNPTAIIGWILQEVGIVPREVLLSDDPVVRQVVSLKTELYGAKIATGADAILGSVDFVEAAVAKYGTSNCVMVTTAYRTEVEPYLERHGLVGKFAALVTGDDTPSDQRKPHPYAFQRAVEILGHPAANVAAVEDTPHGLMAAAGLWRAGITTTHSAADLRPYADKVVDSFDELKRLLI